MAAKGRHWTPEEIQAMQRQHAGGMTLAEIGELHEITKQRVSFLLGRPGRSKKRSELKLKARSQDVVSRVKAGLTDAEIASELTLAAGTVVRYRLDAGYVREKHWDRPSLLLHARQWHKFFGYWPRTTDWAPTYVRSDKRFEYEARLENYRSHYGWPPHTSTVLRLYASWATFIQAAKRRPLS